MVDLLGPGAFGAARAAATRPPLVPANGPGDPDSWARDCSAPAVNDGTENRAGLFNMLIAQLRRSIRASGVAPNNGDDDMLVKAIRSQRTNYAPTVGGTANAPVIQLDPAPTSWNDLINIPFDVRPALSNTAAAPTLEVVDLAGPRTIVRRDGWAVQPFDLLAGVVYRMRYNGTYVVLDGIASNEYRRVLLGVLNLYVRADGNDANDGLADTPTRAFRQPQAAVLAALRRYDTAGQLVAINLADGSYGPIVVDRAGSTNMLFRGNLADSTKVVIDGTSSPTGDALAATAGSHIAAEGLFVWSDTRHAMIAYNASSILFGNCTFGAAGGAHMQASGNALIAPYGSYTIASGAQWHMNAVFNGFVQIDGRSVFIPNPAVFGTFAFSRGGNVSALGTGFTGAGVAGTTGQRYRVEGGGNVYTAGGGANFFPGNAAGSIVNGNYI